MARVRHVIRKGRVVHVKVSSSSGRSRTRKSSTSRREPPRDSRGRFKRRR